MSNVLVLFAHPLLEKSRVQVELLKIAGTVKNVTVNDLYERYPEFDIDIAREKDLLLKHDIIIWQHPLYWYNAPAIIKQWMDLVLEHGWAYGKNGFALKGKRIFNVISSGGGEGSYQQEGFNKYTIHDFLRPFERTAVLCRMSYWPPFWVHGVHLMEPTVIQQYCAQYRHMLTALTNDIFSDEEIGSHSFMNEIFPITSIKENGK
jgi:glutathione-regulated potassium-efflux system ancillary protein KefG